VAGNVAAVCVGASVAAVSPPEQAAADRAMAAMAVVVRIRLSMGERSSCL
jgi:hypothetical protein